MSVKKADCASRAGMIEVLQSLAAYCPMDPKGWHPPLVSPTAGAAQSVMVAGDYGFVEMGLFCTTFTVHWNFCHNHFSAQKVLYNLSGEKQNIARMAGIVPVMQQWHKKKVSLIMDENYEKRVTLNV